MRLFEEEILSAHCAICISCSSVIVSQYKFKPPQTNYSVHLYTGVNHIYQTARMQGMPSQTKQSMLQVGRDVFTREGLRGLYRGGLPMVVGGSLMRSAQFGVSGKVADMLKNSSLPEFKLFGIIDYKVVLAGIAGGLGRGVVEAPADFFKVRRQVEQGWSMRQIVEGTSVTLTRNALLYAAFVVYMDLAKQACAGGYVPSALTTEDGNNLSPFAKGAICANLAWLTLWPMDVVKTQRQSGNFGEGAVSLLKRNLASGQLFRGVVPGLARSTIANGCSMVVYEYVHTNLSRLWGKDRKDLV